MQPTTFCARMVLADRAGFIARLCPAMTWADCRRAAARLDTHGGEPVSGKR